jgi:hypothetical protein
MYFCTFCQDLFARIARDERRNNNEGSEAA